MIRLVTRVVSGGRRGKFTNIIQQRMTKRTRANEAEPRMEEGEARPPAKKLKLSSPGSMEHLKLPKELEGKLDFALADRKTVNGMPWNLKIVSWNVNGIRATLKSGKIGYLKYEDADIICLQETKCSKSDFPMEAKFQGYHKYFNSPTEKKGYSGVALYSKTKPLAVTYGINIPDHDAEGRVITAEYDTFYLVNVYVPNSGRALVRLDYRRVWNTDFLAYTQTLDAKKPVIVTGDLNVSHQEIDLANPKGNVKNSGFTPEERADFTAWLEAGFLDSYRYFYPDTAGAYTYWSNFGNARAKNVGWRLDYYIVSKRLIQNVADNIIRKIVQGSDHCPVILLMCLDSTTRDPSDEIKEKENIGDNNKNEDEGKKENTDDRKESVNAGEKEVEEEVKENNKSDDRALIQEKTGTDFQQEEEEEEGGSTTN